MKYFSPCFGKYDSQNKVKKKKRERKKKDNLCVQVLDIKIGRTFPII